MLACGGSSDSNQVMTPTGNTPVEETRTPSLESYLWAIDAGSGIKSTAALSGTTAYIGTDSGVVLAVNQLDGNDIWRRELGGKISGGLLYVEGKLLTLNADGILYALDGETGDTIWSLATAGESFYDRWDYHTNTPIEQDGVVYIASRSGVFSALNLENGDEKWSYDLKSNLRGTPVVIGDTAYLSSETSVMSINLLDGSQNWFRTASLPTSPQVANGVVVVGSRDGNVFGFNALNGETLWAVSHSTSWVTGNALIQDDVAYIGSSDNYQFQAINPTSGEVLWAINSGMNVFSKPFIDNNIIYMTSANAYGTPGRGYIKAMTLVGEVLWSIEGRNFIGSPIVRDNQLYVGSDDGFFYSISTTENK